MVVLDTIMMKITMGETIWDQRSELSFFEILTVKFIHSDLKLKRKITERKRHKF